MAGEVQGHGVEGFQIQLVQEGLELDPLPSIRLANQPERRALVHDVRLVVDVEVVVLLLGAILVDVVPQDDRLLVGVLLPI